jgi:hypothetical protein
MAIFSPAGTVTLSEPLGAMIWDMSDSNEANKENKKRGKRGLA